MPVSTPLMAIARLLFLGLSSSLLPLLAASRGGAQPAPTPELSTNATVSTNAAASTDAAVSGVPPLLTEQPSALVHAEALQEPAIAPAPLSTPAFVHPSVPLDLAQTEPQEILEEARADAPLQVPVGQGERISRISVRYANRVGSATPGRTQAYIITREFDLKPGDVYNPQRALEGLRRVVDLNAVRTARLSLEPDASPGTAAIVITIVETDNFAVRLDNQIATPWVLQGLARTRTVGAQPPRLSGFQLPGSLQWRNIGGNDQSLTLGLLAGDRSGGINLTFYDPWIGGTNRLGYAVNIQGLSYLNPTFNVGETAVRLPNANEDFWERRLGFGAQVVQRPLSGLAWAAGLSFQQISVRDQFWGDRVFAEDEFGNALTISDDGIDTLLTLNTAISLDQRNDPIFPTRGSRFRAGVDLSIPIGEASVFYTRPMANFSQFIPLSFIQVDNTPSTLIANVQAGSLIGDAPPYEAFVLGGSSSVRGFAAGELGNPQTFFQATLEYRFPFASVAWGEGLLRRVLGRETVFAGSVFVDYATGFGTQALITGEPGVVRNKPGAGWGFGVGLLAATDVGLLRLEFGISDEGGTTVVFNIGDRF